MPVAPIVSKNMLGKTDWFLKTNDTMFAGAYSDGIIARVGIYRTDSLIKSGEAEPFNPRGGNKAMKEYVLISGENIAKDTVLLRWLDGASEFAGALPLKQKKPR
jgi:TfoX/Sxy family transcriptional regulator of competence genes